MSMMHYMFLSMKMIRFIAKISVLGGLAILCLFGCSTVGYYSQSVLGHSKLMLARQPINKAIAASEGETKRQLQLAVKLRQFAVERLALPDNDSYLSYVPLKRKYPVWSVVATPEFSLQPQRWCYPIIGCAAYRGYFSQASAQQYADSLIKKNYETEVGGAIAYSTLGWFNDPLIPPMMRDGDVFLAQVMFHELAHQQLYVKGNSAFNEAFATVVGEQGTLLWLQENSSANVENYRHLMQARNDFSALVKNTKLRLEVIYESELNDEQKRQQKQQMFEQLHRDYETLKTSQWADKAYYASWFDKPLNNARLAAFATYRDLVPDFEELFLKCRQGYARFYRVVSLQKREGKNAQVPRDCGI